MKILFITRLSGRLANQLINLSLWFALGEAYNYAIVPCSFGWEMDFVGTRKHLFSRYVLLHSAAKVVRRVNIGYEQERDATSLILDVLERGESATINLEGWLPRALWRDVPAKKLRRYFMPTRRHLMSARRVCQTARGGQQPLFGVHIRHTDFAHHDGGRWFLPLETVVRNMQYVRALRPDARFLVCSDARFNNNDFPGFDVAFGSGGVVSDLTALGLCDFILKPAYSSFALWSAWWGNTPCLAMQKEPKFQMGNFQVPELDPFADSQNLAPD